MDYFLLFRHKVNLGTCSTLRRFRIYSSLFEITADGVFLRKTPIHYGYFGLHRIRKRYSGRCQRSPIVREERCGSNQVYCCAGNSQDQQ
jgi:hypothetical protein